MSYVYFITPEAAFCRSEQTLRCVKIGVTRGHPEERLRALSCGSPVSLDLFGFISGDHLLERALHETFAPLRLHGEWFAAERKLRDFLGWFEDMPLRNRLIACDLFEESIYVNVFGRSSPGPWLSDREYLESADMRPLQRLYPHVWTAAVADNG